MVTDMQMKAVEITRYGGRFEYNSRPIPRAASNEVVLKVEASGLCSTDLHLLEGRMDLGALPRIPGHETAGIVVEVGAEVKGWTSGARAVVGVDIVCGSCRHCLTGHPQRCLKRVRIGFERDGGHAEYLAVPAGVLVPLPDEIGFEEAAILPDAVACMHHCLLSRGGLKANDRILILGAGGLGIHGVQIASIAGAQVIATSRKPERLKAVARYRGVPVNPSTDDLRDVVRAITHGEGVDMVADCIGTVGSIKEALSLVRAGGRVLVVAYLAEEFSLSSLDMMLNEKELIGCRGSTLADLREVVELTRSGKIEPVVGRRFHLSEIEKAARALRDGAMVGRIVLTR